MELPSIIWIDGMEEMVICSSEIHLFILFLSFINKQLTEDGKSFCRMSYFHGFLQKKKVPQTNHLFSLTVALTDIWIKSHKCQRKHYNT